MTPAHALIALLITLLSGCSASNPIATTNPADVQCPDLTGSYCARGRMYITGEDRIQTVSLARFLPPINPDCYDNPKVCEAKRLDIAGGDDGQLSITLYADEQPVALLNLQSNQFSCGNHTLLVDTAGGLSVEVGPPMMPIVAVGWSDANSLFWKAEDGGLRVRKLSKTSVALMLAIPISIDEESWARFRTTEQGCD